MTKHEWCEKNIDNVEFANDEVKRIVRTFCLMAFEDGTLHGMTMAENICTIMNNTKTRDKIRLTKKEMYDNRFNN